MDTLRIPSPTLPAVLPTDHQALMDIFHDHWTSLNAQIADYNRAIHPRANDVVTIVGIDGFLRTPTEAEIAAVMPAKVNAAALLGRYNYQVENGGHDQHAGNGYAEDLKPLLRLTEGAARIGIEHGAELHDIVETYARRLRDAEGGSDAHRFGVLFGDDSEDCDGPDHDDLDTRLYALPMVPLMQTILDRFDEIVAATFMPVPLRMAA